MSGIFGELLNFPQENGPEVRLRVFGDEHYARYEQDDGYSVVYDQAKGLFCFADLAGNRLVSTGVPIDELPPSHLARYLQETPAVRRAKSEQRALLHHPPEAANFERIVRTFGPNQGLLSGRQLSIGAVRGLTILVNFADVNTATTKADVSEMLNGASYSRNGNICSVREYFQQVSNGKLDYTNVVVGPFTLSKPRQDYINELLVPEALQLAVDSGLDLTQFDSRGEGILDALNILYAGQSLYQGELWPHNSFIDLTFGAIRTNLYLLTGLGRAPAELSIGTFCHENGHLLCRFPDMYDYGNRDNDTQDSAGIGYYCLMGAGNHLDFGRSPAPVCAYLRDLAGWCDTVIDLNVPGDYRVAHGEYGSVLKFRTRQPNEYFLVENRSRLGLDRASPSSGLAVYHCDILGSNEYQQGTATQHYQCALLQADGQRALENNLNPGDGTDLFGPVAGVALAGSSRPHSREWDGRESGLVISDIQIDDQVITLRLGQAEASQIARAEATPEANIPDNSATGVSDSLIITASGVIRRLKVTVDISHTYVGDLSVVLLSPTGRRAILHAREGGSGKDLKKDYDSDRPGELSSLVGQPMQGTWILTVADRAANDQGIFHKWSLDIESTSV